MTGEYDLSIVAFHYVDDGILDNDIALGTNRTDINKIFDRGETYRGT